jgi:hypothetical protein
MYWFWCLRMNTWLAPISTMHSVEESRNSMPLIQRSAAGGLEDNEVT